MANFKATIEIKQGKEEAAANIFEPYAFSVQRLAEKIIVLYDPKYEDMISRLIWEGILQGLITRTIKHERA